MDDLAEQIVEHFPTEDKVFIMKLLKDIVFKDLFSNSRRNPGIIVMVPLIAAAFFAALVTPVTKWANKPTIHALQKMSLTLSQVRMMTMKRNL